MPRIPAHLSLRLAETADPCVLCAGTRFAVGFRLFDHHRDDRVVYHGCSICPECASRHGYHGVVIQALAMEEMRTLATDAAYVAAGLEGPAQLALSRFAFAQLRRLVVDDRLDTPPSIPVDCFDDSPSEKSAALAFYERLTGIYS